MASKSIPSHAGPPAKSTAAPSPTLYLRNLNDKLKRSDLQKELYYLFTTYGRVLDVNVMPGSKMRGQAHIVFPDVHASTQALRELQGFNFHGREIKIDYGKSRSHIFNKLEGEYKTTEDEKKEHLSAVQQSVFEAPRPGQAPAAQAPSASGLPSKPLMPEPQQGTKRPREDDEEEAKDEEEEEEEAAMDEDEDDDVEMEQSDED